MENVNKTYVVGTLKDVEIREGESDRGTYMAGKFKVAVSEENIVEHTFFSYEMTQNNTISSRYRNYQGIKDMEGQRVKVTGSINSRAFYSSREGQVIHFNEVSTSFVNIAKDTDENTSTFEYSGYVIKPLHERNDKEGNLVSYEIEVGQADYKGENLVLVKFSVNPDMGAMVNSIQEHYTKNTTISIVGEIKHRVSIVEQKVEVMFGEPTVKHFENVIKTYEITGGKEPIMTDAAYTQAQIKKLEDSYQNYLTKIEEDAKNQVESGKTTVADAPAKKDTHKLV